MSQKDKVKLAAELVRKGGILLAQPCPQCGGIQVRFHGKVYCTKHDELAPVVKTESISLDTTTDRAKEALLMKLSEDVRLLEEEKDPVKQEQLVSVMSKCYELLQKLLEKRQSP